MQKNNWAWRETLLTAILLPPILAVAAILLGIMIDGVAQHSEQHDRCMKQATSGYEIERCR